MSGSLLCRDFVEIVTKPVLSFRKGSDDNRFLTDKGIPEGFLKSNYFTLRPQLVQLYQEDPTFRTRLEEALDGVEEQVARDYKMLVNETNRTYLSKYPFEEVARALGIQPSVRGFSASKNKLDTIKQHSLTIPGVPDGPQGQMFTRTRGSENGQRVYSV